MDVDLCGLVMPLPDEFVADQVVRLRGLLADGVDLAVRDDNGATPLHHAVEAPYDDSGPLPSLDVVRVLLEAGADVHATDRNDVTPAGRAVLLNDTMPASAVERSVAVLELLVAHGARLDGAAGFSDGGSFAHHSCTAPEVYAFLLEHGAPTAVTDDEGDTPLHATISAQRPRLVELLLRHNVDTRAVNHLGQTPLGVAQHLSQYTEEQRQGRAEIIAMLEAAGAPAHVSYPYVEGGPLPIDMDVVRRCAEGIDDPDLLRCLEQTYDSYQHFVAERMSISVLGLDTLVDVCRTALGDTGTTITLTGDQELRHPFFHHGDLVVDGNLVVTSRFLVTGDLTVAGCLSDAGPDSCVAVGGRLRARGVDTDGEMYVSGVLEADVVYGYYNDFTLTADVIRGRLVIADDHAVAADVEADVHYDLDDYEQGYGDGVQERLRTVLVDEVFADDDGGPMLDRHALFALLRQGKPVFRA